MEQSFYLLVRSLNGVPYRRKLAGLDVHLTFVDSFSFCEIGFKINSISNQVTELSVKYDSHDLKGMNDACSIDTANENKVCQISFIATADMEPPILLYYEIDNFFQNHRKYVTSRDDVQVRTYACFIIQLLILLRIDVLLV